MSLVDFINARFGRNWVVFARRTKRIVARYGVDVVVIHPKKYRLLVREFEATQ